MYSGGGGAGPGPAEPPAAYMYRSQPEIHHTETDVRTETELGRAGRDGTGKDRTGRDWEGQDGTGLRTGRNGIRN